MYVPPFSGAVLHCHLHAANVSRTIDASADASAIEKIVESNTVEQTVELETPDQQQDALQDEVLLAQDLPEMPVPSAADLAKMIAVPIGGFSISKNKTVITRGVEDCVVFAFYNQTYGVYLGHFLRENQFIRDHESGVEDMRPNEKVSLDFKLGLAKAKSVSESLPNWVNDPDTIGYAYSGDPVKMHERIDQLRKAGIKTPLKVFYSNSSSRIDDDIYSMQEIEKVKAIVFPNIPDQLKRKWLDEPAKYVTDFGITSEGVFFRLNIGEDQMVKNKFVLSTSKVNTARLEKIRQEAVFEVK